MQKVIRKTHEGVNWTAKLTPMVGWLPTTMAGLMWAATALWAAGTFWFLFNLLLWRILY